MACPRFFPPLDQSSKINVFPDPVGAWTTTSFPDRSPATASCCQRSGTATWLRRDRLPICSAIVPTGSRYLSLAGVALVLYHNRSCGQLVRARLPGRFPRPDWEDPSLGPLRQPLERTRSIRCLSRISNLTSTH